MAELFRDQPDYYSTANLPIMVEDSHADAIVVPGEGWGGQAAWSGDTEDAWAIWFHQRAGQTAGIFSAGHRLRVDAYPAAEKIILGFTDYLKVLQCCVSLDTDGTLRIYKGDLGGTLLTESAAGAMPLATELAFGATGIVAPVGGSFEVWMGESDDVDTWAVIPGLQINGVDTAGGTGSEWLGVYLGLTPDIFHSHLYARDGRSGEGGIIGLSPAYRVTVGFSVADGIYSAWQPSSGSSKYAMVDEVDHDGDTTHIFGVDGEQNESYSQEFEEFIANTSVIYGVDFIQIAQKTADADLIAARFSQTVVYDASTVATPFARPWVSLFEGVWRAVRECIPVSLKTGNPWTTTELNDAEFGGVIQ